LNGKARIAYRVAVRVFLSTVVYTTLCFLTFVSKERLYQFQALGWEIGLCPPRGKIFKPRRRIRRYFASVCRC
jgi:hypothetical protein